jgi:glycolate oxidase
MERLARERFPDGALIVDDIAVPRSRLVDMIKGTEKVAALYGVTVGIVGHAGDGNLHPNIVVDRADPASLAAGRQVFDEILRLGLDLGGTITGEHGIGVTKLTYLEQRLGPVGIDLLRGIKHAFDPLGLLNPGKAVP